MPSLIFPPTTESSRAPVTMPPTWPQPCRTPKDGTPSRTLFSCQPHMFSGPKPQSHTAHLNAPGIVHQHLLHLACSLGFLKYLNRVSGYLGYRLLQALHFPAWGLENPVGFGKSSGWQSWIRSGRERNQEKLNYPRRNSGSHCPHKWKVQMRGHMRGHSPFS